MTVAFSNEVNEKLIRPAYSRNKSVYVIMPTSLFDHRILEPPRQRSISSAASFDAFPTLPKLIEDALAARRATRLNCSILFANKCGKAESDECRGQKDVH
jgi:hypothetical protein